MALAVQLVGAKGVARSPTATPRACQAPAFEEAQPPRVFRSRRRPVAARRRPRSAMQKVTRTDDSKRALATGPLPNKRCGGARLSTKDPSAKKGKGSVVQRQTNVQQMGSV